MRTLTKGRIAFLAILLLVIVCIYLVFLYKLQIIEGEEYYNASNEITTEKSTVTAARGNILDRYGRTIISNKEIYNLKIDTAKLFADDDPNGTILALVNLVREYGDEYTDDLPITSEPPFEYLEDMTAIQRTMLEAYIEDKSGSLPENPTAVELLSYMRTRYSIDNNYTAEEMRIIAGIRYSINVRYAINTSDYIFVEDGSMKLITSIMETKLAGINVDRAFTREYQTKYAAHLLGYVGLMTQEEYEKYSLLNYANDAMVGKDGVEYAFEEYLHGTDGTVVETKNPSGTVLATVYETEPEPGNHVYLTIDLSLQEQMERILDNGINILIKERVNTMNEQKALGTWTYDDGLWEVTGGAAVAVNVKTGEPLAICSWPTYDVSTIIENYASLLEEDNSPLFNRALNGAYAPGSTFKPCTAIAGLTSPLGKINTETLIDCLGVYTRYASDGYAPECWIWSSTKDHLTHPEENVTTALRDSCNYFFYTVSNDLGVDELGTYAHAFGLGVSTGIELNEAEGNMSNQANHMDYAGSEWRIGDTLQAGIGQSDSVFTPLQLAEYVATVANSGTRYSASILKSVRTYDYSTTIYERGTQIKSVVESAEYNWYAVHQGMYLVANDWTNESVAKYFIPASYVVAAKTGTAQKGEGIINDGIFICYAPFNDPEIAIAIVVERGGAGANLAFMAREMLDVYFNMKSYTDSSEAEMDLLK